MLIGWSIRSIILLLGVGITKSQSNLGSGNGSANVKWSCENCTANRSASLHDSDHDLASPVSILQASHSSSSVSELQDDDDDKYGYSSTKIE